MLTPSFVTCTATAHHMMVGQSTTSALHQVAAPWDSSTLLCVPFF